MHGTVITLYRPNLSLTSGAGQLIRMQAEGLQAAGEEVRIGCARGSLRFRLRTRLPARRASIQALRRLAAAPQQLVVDHGMAIPEAGVVFVHNVVTEGVRHLERPDWAERARGEAEFFAALPPNAPVVANSELVKRALIEHFRLDAGRVIVHYPGYDSRRFTARDRAAASAAARRELGLDAHAPVVGFVTSGDFAKRGLDIFLAAAERIAEARPDVRFLVVGAKRLPEFAARHELVRDGRLAYSPKGVRPERSFAALDIFLYPARFEEFGMVVSEAQACGVPVLTSRRVGAAECLPAEYDGWVLDEPDAEQFARRALALLADDTARRRLAVAGAASVRAFAREHYVRETLETILSCARRKAGEACE
ncbi:MAG TPA: glycosyltransferase family 4 protein [Gammaproteobacteria bacterium]